MLYEVALTDISLETINNGLKFIFILSTASKTIVHSQACRQKVKILHVPQMNVQYTFLCS